MQKCRKHMQECNYATSKKIGISVLQQLGLLINRKEGLLENAAHIPYIGMAQNTNLFAINMFTDKDIYIYI